MKKINTRGFTLIELMVIVIILLILLTLVGLTYNGVQSKNRNGQRQADIDILQSHLETYYAQASRYPSLADINNESWRAANLKELKTNELHDPKWHRTNPVCGPSDKVLAGSPAVRCYAYQVTTTEGEPCDNDKKNCAQYTLTATLEGGDKYVKSSLN